MLTSASDENVISYDEFTALAEEELALLPDYVHDELNGGVLVDHKAYLHPARVADDLYVLGTYSSKPVMGKQIVLYYGSFLATLPPTDRHRWRTQVRDTLRHEFQHHLETRAGLYNKDTLVEEDFNRMMTYFLKHRRGGID